MIELYVNIHKPSSSLSGWGCVARGFSSPNKEIMGASEGSEMEALLSALLAGLQATAVIPGLVNVEVVTFHAPLAYALEQGACRWASHNWRRKACIEAMNSPLWRKLAKASKRVSLIVRTPTSLEDFELMGRAAYYGSCALGQNMVHKLFTDGSFVPKGKAGGWAVILESGREVTEMSGGMNCRDCNQAELLAVIKGLSFLNDRSNAIVYTDSRFVVTGTRIIDLWMQSNWRTAERKRVPHRDLWEALYQQMQRLSVRFEWIKGHSGIEQNFRADQLAKREAKNLLLN